MLSVYNDLNEVIELLLAHFDTFIPSLNDIDEGFYNIDMPEILIHFIPLDSGNIVTINREKYVFAIVGNYLSGYMKQKWVKRSPIIVYPVYYKGKYADEFYFTKAEREERANEIVEAYNEV